MNSKKAIYAMIISSVIIAGAVLYVGVTHLQAQAQNQKPIIGAREIIRIQGAERPVELEAKIDTGADSSSIDEDFAKSIGLDTTTTRKKTIVNARGRERRDVINITLTVGTTTIQTEATLANRNELSTDVLIGRQDLEQFIVDPSQEFLTTPASKRPDQNLSAISGTLSQLPRNQKMLLIFPILGAIIVLERLLLGFRTYGIFGPVAIAYSLLYTGIGSDILLYIILILLGLAIKILLMKNFQLSHIAEMSLLMFFLTIAILAIEFYQPFLPLFTLTTAFFPLIITSYLIENAGKTAAEHSVSDTIPLLFSTLAVAVILGIIGTYLTTISALALWIVFGSSIVGVLAASSYRGLRLAELIRFRFFRQPDLTKDYA